MIIFILIIWSLLSSELHVFTKDRCVQIIRLHFMSRVTRPNLSFIIPLSFAFLIVPGECSYNNGLTRKYDTVECLSCWRGETLAEYAPFQLPIAWCDGAALSGSRIQRDQSRRVPGVLHPGFRHGSSHPTVHRRTPEVGSCGAQSSPSSSTSGRLDRPWSSLKCSILTIVNTDNDWSNSLAKRSCPQTARWHVLHRAIV